MQVVTVGAAHLAQGRPNWFQPKYAQCYTTCLLPSTV